MPQSPKNVRSSSRPSSRLPGRRTWTRMGAIVASATLGSGMAATAEAAPANLKSAPIAATAEAVARAERSVSAWEHPWDVMLAAYRVAITPGERDGAGWMALPSPESQQAPVYRFAIAAGPLPNALRALEALTGVSVTVPQDLASKISVAGLSGTLTVDQALSRLMEGTGLTFKFVNARTVEVEFRVNEQAVDVTDRLPSLSSPKFSQPLVDTPQTITVVPRTVIESQGATTLRDVLRNVPGITMQAGEGGGGLPGDSMSIRGFSATNDIFVDGARDVAAYSRDSYNIEQVEVIKGPASTFGGRGSTGGAVNLSTKTPGIESIRQGTVAFGTAGSQRITADANEALPSLGAGTALRVNAMWQDAGVPGRDVVQNESWAIAPTLALGLTSQTRVIAGYQHLTQNNVPDYGLPWGSSTDPVSGEAFPTGAFNATPAIDQRNFYGLRNYDFEHITSDVATVRLDRDLPRSARLNNISRYGETYRDSAITAPRPPNRQLQRREMRNGALANQTSLALTLRIAGIRHDVTSGVDVAREETFSRNSAQSINQPQTNIRQPDPDDLPLGPMPNITGNPATASTSTVGAYLFDTATLGDRWQVSGGARWDRSDVTFQQTALSTGQVTELERTDNVVSWRGGVVYKPSANASVYASYGTSFNPASDAAAVTALSEAPTAANNVNLEPERSRNAEVGSKWTLFSDRLAVSGALFRTQKTNARTRVLTSDPYVLAGRQRVQGIELSASGEIRPGWTALASFSALDSEIEDSANTLEEGRDLAFTPRRTASIWMTWQARPRFMLGGGAQFMDSVFRNTTSDLRVPSYWLVNALASYEINSHLTLRLNATNLGDTQYVDRVGGGHYIPGPRRAVQLTTGIGF